MVAGGSNSFKCYSELADIWNSTKPIRDGHKYWEWEGVVSKKIIDYLINLPSSQSFNDSALINLDYGLIESRECIKKEQQSINSEFILYYTNV